MSKESINRNDNTLKEMSHLQSKVFMLLPKGMDELISTREIENILNIDERHIRIIVEELITDYDIPVGSMRGNNNFGYFIATNMEEKIKGTLSLSHQAAAMNRRVEKVKVANVDKVFQYRKLYIDYEPDHDKQLNLLESER